MCRTVFHESATAGSAEFTGSPVGEDRGRLVVVTGNRPEAQCDLRF
jgi:hypothetical protein